MSFCSEFTDGTQVLTSNRTGIYLEADDDATFEYYQFPNIDDPLELYRDHSALIAPRILSLGRYDKVKDWVQKMYEDDKESFQRLAKQGFIGFSSGSDSYSMTWKYELYSLLLSEWPIGNILKQRNIKKSQDILQRRLLAIGGDRTQQE
ncbi:MAG: hypothetical protein AAFX40_05585 [Cyanobacteria bacterium J06639_1]